MPDQGELTLHGSGRLDAAVRGRVEAKGLDVPGCSGLPVNSEAVPTTAVSVSARPLIWAHW